jgi:hypothetical protein
MVTKVGWLNFNSLVTKEWLKETKILFLPYLPSPLSSYCKRALISKGNTIIIYSN